MKCEVEGCLEESRCRACNKCQYHHDEEIGELSEYSIKPRMDVPCVKDEVEE